MESHFSSYLCNKILSTQNSWLWPSKMQATLYQGTVHWYTGKKRLLLKKQRMYLAFKSQNLICLLGPTPIGIASKSGLTLKRIPLISICKRNLTIGKEKQAIRWGQFIRPTMGIKIAWKLESYFCLFSAFSDFQ